MLDSQAVLAPARTRGQRSRRTAPSAPPSLAAPARIGWIVGAIVAAAAAIRIAAATGELWLDEIWSLRLAHLAAGPLGVFTGIHVDNNHHLNTLVLQLLPESGIPWIAYRVHALAAGIATVVLAAVIARRAGRVASIAAAALIGGSFLLTLYGSEARGYALAVCFAFAATASMLGEPGRAGPAHALAFALACSLGVLSHVTFLFGYVGLLVWTAARAVRAGTLLQALARMVLLHLLPIATLVGLYWVDLRHVVEGGGPLTSPLAIAARALSLQIGGPDGGELHGIAATIALGVTAFSIASVRRSGSDLWLLFATAGIVTPALALLFIDSSLLFERYFLVPLAFLTLAAAWLVARCAASSRLVAVLLVVAYLGGNAVQIARLVRDGRGSYIAALSYMRDHGRIVPIVVGSDHDFRQGRVIEFYQSAVAGDFVYVARANWPPPGPEWLLIHSQTPDFAPEAQITVQGGRQYSLRQVYRSAALSGWHLALYQR
jgi:hypothetical protein